MSRAERADEGEGRLHMISSQLGRIVLSARSVSEDEQEAATDEAGSYGELMDAIDRVLEQVDADEEDPPRLFDPDAAPGESSPPDEGPV